MKQDEGVRMQTFVEPTVQVFGVITDFVYFNLLEHHNNAC